MTPANNIQTQEERDLAEELAAKRRWINFGVATAVTWVVIMLTDKAIAPEIDLSRSFGKYLGGSFALQIFPIFFGWIARKIKFTSEKWMAVYWFTLGLVLTVRAILLSRIVAG